jgi:hypothetical protein
MLNAGIQQRLKPARAIKRGEVIEAADMALTDVYLWHGTTPGALNHLGTPLRLEINADLVDLGDTPGAQ